MFENLLQVLKLNNISIYKLSELSCIAKSDLYNAINGKKPFYPNWKKRVAQALNTTEESLFNEEAERTVDEQN